MTSRRRGIAAATAAVDKAERDLAEVERVLAEEAELKTVDDLRTALGRAQKKLKEAHAKAEALVKATIDGARDAQLALGPIPRVPTPPKDNRRGHEEVALWHLTDWQGAKVTTSYNSEVMRARVAKFVAKAKTITDIHRQHHPIRSCVILFGGDMIEGLFNYPSQPFDIDASLFGQYTTVSRVILEAVRAALADHQQVTVVAEWGNHGRLGPKRAVVPRSDNADRMTYELARQLLLTDASAASRTTWEDSAEDVQRVEIGNYRALLIHGDEIGRNGFASPMTIVRHADRWRSGAYPWAFRDLYCGHYHTHAEWPMANGLGAVYQTGSTESDNRYARDTMAASAVPSQRLHFVDPSAGRVTAQYKVFLD